MGNLGASDFVGFDFQRVIDANLLRRFNLSILRSKYGIVAALGCSLAYSGTEALILLLSLGTGECETRAMRR